MKACDRRPSAVGFCKFSSWYVPRLPFFATAALKPQSAFAGLPKLLAMVAWVWSKTAMQGAVLYHALTDSSNWSQNTFD